MVCVQSYCLLILFFRLIFQANVLFTISSTAFHTADLTTGDLVVLPGSYSVFFTDGIGGNQTVKVNVVGDKQIVEKFPSV